jgi:hypothetical protein
MITLLSITASILALYGVCVTYLLWVWYGRHGELERRFTSLKKNSDEETKEAYSKYWKLKDELAHWQNRTGLAEAVIEQVRAVIK